jgi:predicted RNA-binding protein associated with RNAse of E/G family
MVTECEVGQGTREAGRPVMHLIPKAAWWIAMWCDDGSLSLINVDICTPATLVHGEWTYTDLELDPHTFPDGRVEIDDEDEFLAACDSGLISPAEAIEARNAAQDIERYLRDGIEPFGRVGWQRLHEAMNLALAPLTALHHVPAA